jgi:hypothetical protein
VKTITCTCLTTCDKHLHMLVACFAHADIIVRIGIVDYIETSSTVHSLRILCRTEGKQL